MAAPDAVEGSSTGDWFWRCAARDFPPALTYFA
jgi:hypothetical protein